MESDWIIANLNLSDDKRTLEIGFVSADHPQVWSSSKMAAGDWLNAFYSSFLLQEERKLTTRLKQDVEWMAGEIERLKTSEADKTK